MKTKLSENERKVLKYLVTDARTPCTEIAKDLGITSQAVGKIKEKLEKQGIIRGYTAEVDYKKLGVEVFVIALFRFKSGVWSNMEEADMLKRIRGPHLVGTYRITEGDYTHMIIYGFRSMREVEHYFHQLQKERGHVSELKKFYVLTADSVLKDSPRDLVTKVIDEMGEEKLASPEYVKPMPGMNATESGFFT